jgi:hypothetical protein
MVSSYFTTHTKLINYFIGHAEQWGSVSRKKDKKTSGVISPSPSGTATGAPTHRDQRSHGHGHRGGFQRGGGRGGRGGGRGGAYAGRPSSRSQIQATSSTGGTYVTPAQTTSNGWGVDATSTTGDAANDGWGVTETSSWGEDNTTIAEITKVEEPPAPVPVSTNGVAKAKAATPTLAPAKATPVAGAVRSWAQVAM